MKAHSAQPGRLLSVILISVLTSILPACTPPPKPVAHQAHAIYRSRQPVPPQQRSKPVEQAVAKCLPPDSTGLSAAEKAQVFKQFDRWYSANRNDNNPAAADASPKGPVLDTLVGNSQVDPTCPSTR
jgi:type IV pilus biogenesis protein CpaD/CtpE